MPNMPADSSPFIDHGKRSMGDLFPGIVDRLQSEADDRVGKRRLVEDRWLLDVQQFEGRDDELLMQELAADGRSSAVVNITKAKCNVFESKLYDMLFPTDDKNWAINPTPVPELDLEVKKLGGTVERLTAEANAAEDPDVAQGFQDEADEVAQALMALETTRADARDQADLMSAEIEDNLVETEYAIHCRDVIHDATVAGTGILKGPIPLSERVRMNWIQEDGGHYRMKAAEDHGDRFAYQHTSYWNLFPNTGARSFKRVDSWFERYVMHRRDLIDFAKQPNVDLDAVRRLLDEGPSSTLPEYMLQVDTVANEEQSSIGDDVYVVWEYRGPLETDEMETLLRFLVTQKGEEDGEEGETAGDVEIEIDPLMQVDAVVWFCQGEILRVAINHMDDNAPIYSFFQIEKSVARMWGVGVPYLMRTQAGVMNDAWRLMLDNAAFAAFPQVEINPNVVQKTDEGDQWLEPFGLWERMSNAGGDPGLIFHDIPVHQEHFAAIIQLAMQHIDQETNISVLAAGEQGAASRTAGGMALLMNSVNVVFRRVVRNFDDGITTPVITRAYNFLMQFSPKEEIKGDYTVQARGSSVLLVREVQAQNLLVLIGQVLTSPELQKRFHLHELLKKMLQSMMLSSDDILLTKAELEAVEAAEAEAAAQAPPDPEMAKLQLEAQKMQMDGELSQMEMQSKKELLLIQIEAELTKMAQQGQITLAEGQTRLQAAREKIMSDERRQAQEAAIESRRDAQGVERGSGGTF